MIGVPHASTRRRAVLGAALLATLGLLLAHAAVYRFLTDDAFISFRYARNLREGHGLVFNPGLERVEGYTNFLWVLLLAGCDALGLPPETAANLLSLAATIGLWGVVVWFVLRHPPPAGREWLAVVPPLLLAATRSVAVWSTSGLETRFYELLILGGLCRLLVEVRGQVEIGRPGRPIAALLLALATLTRPDGLLIAATAFGAAAVYLNVHGRLRLPGFAARLGVFAVPVALHFLFRRLYYGDWLPNTYHVKVGGRTWWDMGWTYLGAFALEYAVYLWIPLLVAGVLHHLRRRTGFVPLLFLGVIAAQALYMASVGGDHFEYRPLDLVFPLAYLLMYGGAQHFARGRGAAVATAGGLILVLGGLLALPCQTRRQFPDRYLDGFPGQGSVEPDRTRFLDPARDPIYGLPGLRGVARAHRALLGRMTGGYVGLRQEEHRLFLASVVPEGRRLALLVREGRIAPGAYLAISCVGAIPYYSDLPVLDRLGLTDARVARSPFKGRSMAHDKHATLAYARERGADLWAFDEVHALLREDDFRLYGLLQVAAHGEPEAPVYVAGAGDGWVLLGILPRGIGPGASRFPGLRFRRADDSETTRPLLARAVRLFGERARLQPANPRARLEYAAILLYRGEVDASIEALAGDAAAGDPRALFGLGQAFGVKGDPRRSLQYFQEAARVAPEFQEAHYEIGRALAELGEHRRAVEAFARALRLRPYDPAARLALGEAYLALGDVVAASREHRVLTRIDARAAARLERALRR